jgi:hypothetical protein
VGDEGLRIHGEGEEAAQGVAEEGGGERRRGEDVQQDEEPQPGPHPGLEVVLRGEEGAGPPGAVEAKRPKVRLWITTRRVRIDPEAKRRDYIRRLDRLWRQLDRIIADPLAEEANRIKAMNTLIRCLYIVYGMVEAVEVEDLEAEVEEAEGEEGQPKEALGYRLPEPPP